MSSTPRWRWPRPRTSRLVLIGASIVLGVGLVVGARFVGDDWLSSVMIEVGAAVVLIAPLLWAEDVLRRSLGEINASLRSSVAGLSAVRQLLPYGPRRTAIFDDLLEGVRERAADGEFPRSAIASLASGDSDDRTVALAAMVGEPSLVDSAAVLRSIGHPENANEQYYALRAARAAWSTVLSSDVRAAVLQAIERDERDRQWISGSQSRRKIAEELRESARSLEAREA